MTVEQKPGFYQKAKIISIVGLLLTLSDVVFWDPNRSFILNTLIVASGMLTGFVVFYAFFKRINAAKYAIYILALFMIFGVLLLNMTGLAQQIVLIANVVVFLGIILILSIYRDEAREYFRTNGLATGWKVAYGVVVVLVCILTTIGLIFQSNLKAQKDRYAEGFDGDLIMEGTPDPQVMNVCKLQYAAQGLTDEQLDKFCKCATLNLARVTTEPSAVDVSPTALMAKALAVADVCMKKVVPVQDSTQE